MAKNKETAMPNDVGAWGEKDQRDAYDGPLNVGGEKVELGKLPALAAGDQAKAKRAST